MDSVKSETGEQKQALLMANKQRLTSSTLHNQSAINNNMKRKQFSSAILFVGVVIILNLCPFQPDFEQPTQQANNEGTNTKYLASMMHYYNMQQQKQHHQIYHQIQSAQIGYLEKCLSFIKLMFTNPIRLGKRRTRFTVVDAKVLGKMAKMWFIKKKIKKLSKKLKKHTIAVPVFTAIPIYEHSYYPQPHVTHVTHGGMHHAAASSYSPAVTPATAAAVAAAAASSAAAAHQSQQLVTSASNNHQQVAPNPYRGAGGAVAASSPGHFHHHPMPYPHPMQASAHQIINSYAPSPPLYVDEAGGLYGHYGNAYGRYDGGYQLW